MPGKLIIFSAPSGSGKTTIVNHLLRLDLGLEFSISATSRRPRKNEQNGVHYYFLSPRDFKEKIEKDEFIEWEEVYPNQYYGTLKSEFERIWGKGKDIIFDIDVAGSLNLKKQYGDLAFTVFVQVPSLDIMEQRLRSRDSDSEEQLEKRVSKAREELTFAAEFDYLLLNDKLELTLKEAETIVKKFLNK